MKGSQLIILIGAVVAGIAVSGFLLNTFSNNPLINKIQKGLNG